MTGASITVLQFPNFRTWQVRRSEQTSVVLHAARWGRTAVPSSVPRDSRGIAGITVRCKLSQPRSYWRQKVPEIKLSQGNRCNVFKRFRSTDLASV